MKALAHMNRPLILDNLDRKLVASIQAGLPLSSQPYVEVGQQIGLSEADVLQRLGRLLDMGVIKRMGVVVRHRELGYRANAMVVWDVPDEKIDELGNHLRQFEFVTLCYQRPRCLPQWPYNLFCMIHGQDRDTVLASVQKMITVVGLQQINHEVLFSRRRFKQCGASYVQQDKYEAGKVTAGAG